MSEFIAPKPDPITLNIVKAILPVYLKRRKSLGAPVGALLVRDQVAAEHTCCTGSQSH